MFQHIYPEDFGKKLDARSIKSDKDELIEVTVAKMWEADFFDKDGERLRA